MSSRINYTWRAKWEMRYPFIISALVTVCYLIYGNELPVNFANLVNQSTSIFGILIGFLITVLTIISSLDNAYLRAIRNDENTFSLFKRYLKNSILRSFYTLLIGILYASFFNGCEFPTKDFSEIIVFFTTSWALLSCYRFIKAFIAIAI